MVSKKGFATVNKKGQKGFSKAWHIYNQKKKHAICNFEWSKYGKERQYYLSESILVIFGGKFDWACAGRLLVSGEARTLGKPR